MLQDRVLKIMKLDDIGFSATWGCGVSKVREVCEKLELPTEDKKNTSMLDAVTNVMLHPGFDAVELTNVCDQESNNFNDLDDVANES